MNVNRGKAIDKFMQQRAIIISDLKEIRELRKRTPNFCKNCFLTLETKHRRQLEHLQVEIETKIISLCRKNNQTNEQSVDTAKTTCLRTATSCTQGVHRAASHPRSS